MRPRPRARLTITLALLTLLAAAFWARSYLPEDFYPRVHRGRLLLIFAAPPHARYIAPQNANNSVRISTADILTDARSWAAQPNGSRTAAAGFEFLLGDMNDGYAILALPFWALTLLLAALTAWSFRAYRRHSLWRRTNHCQNCGYDLRASVDRCPECGHPVPTTALPRSTLQTSA